MKISQCFGSVMLPYCTIDSLCSSLEKTCVLPTEKSLLIHTTHCSRKESTTGLYPWVGESKGLPYCMPVPRRQARSPLHFAWLINKNTWDGEDISYVSLLDQLQMFKVFFFENKSERHLFLTKKKGKKKNVLEYNTTKTISSRLPSFDYFH